MRPVDRLGRTLSSLRVSVTDRCNLRCAYCMPEDEYAWLSRDDLLSLEEIARLTSAFVANGVTKVRLTGGEPLLRAELPALVAKLARLDGLVDLSLTTNGVRLADQARALRDAGLGRVTVSLDTLRADRFRALTGRDLHAAALAGARAAKDAGFSRLKLDAVVIRGVNDDELAGLVGFARELDAEIRFIEYMDVAGATRWSSQLVIARDEVLARIGKAFGAIEAVGGRGSDPAERFRLADGTVFGVIASVTAPFCGACDRARLTADGVFYRCLYATRGLDLRTALRGGASEEELAAVVAGAWRERDDRGAEDRASARPRGPLLAVEALRRDPHLEMHTRGG